MLAVGVETGAREAAGEPSRLYALLALHCAALGHRIVVVPAGGRALVLVGALDRDADRAREQLTTLGTSLTARLSAATGAPVRAGLGEVVPALAGAARSRRSAEQALKALARTGARGPWRGWRTWPTPSASCRCWRRCGRWSCRRAPRWHGWPRSTPSTPAAVWWSPCGPTWTTSVMSGRRPQPLAAPQHHAVPAGPDHGRVRAGPRQCGRAAAGAAATAPRPRGRGAGPDAGS
ncbi:hypothetical protein ACFQ3Z_11595 [Streptomyces nogalater]